MKCANCSNDALYEYKITQKSSVFYCGKDLPRFLYARRDAGLLNTTEAYAEEQTSAIESLTNEVSDSESDEAKPIKKAVKKQAK
jgi:hypothetical protein